MTTQEFNIAVTAFVLAYRAGEIDKDAVRMDNGYDEWLEENLDKFDDDDAERDFAQWKNKDGKKPRDCKESDEVSRMWDEYSKSKAERTDADDDGRWVTTDNGHKVHINDEGVPDKGNPEVIGKMSGGAPDTDKETRIKQLESEMADAKGLMAKSKIKTQIEMLKADWQGTKEEWLAHKKQMQEEAYKKSMEKQAREEAEKKAKAEEEKKQLELEMQTQPKEKVEQYKIIQKNNPMLDDYHVGIRKPSDIKTWDEVLAEDDGDSFEWGDFSKADAEKAQKTGKVRIYSSYPIRQGVFVSTSRIQAQQYAGGEGGKVYSKTIPLSKVAWINGDEGQFADTGSKRTDEDDWVTIKGTHVLIDEEGVAKSGGNLKGKKFQNAKSQKRTAQNKAGGASPFDNEDFLKAAGEADNEVEFWINLTPEQQKMVGKDYKKVYSQLKAKAGDTKPEWAPIHGNVTDMTTKMEDPGKPVSVEIKGSQGTHTASAEGHNVVTLYKGHEHEWNDEVYIHELGHQLSNFGLGTDILHNPGGLWGRYNQKQMVFYGPDDELALSPEESFADCFRDYMVRPERLKKKSKDVYDYFRRMEKDNPWVRGYIKKSLEEIRRTVNAHMHKDSEDGHWFTTENGHKVHINEEGVPDKGNPHVLSKMNGNDPDEFDPFAELMKAAEEPSNPEPAKPNERKAVSGKDITGSYEGDGDIKSVMHAQGFDGLPQVVSDEEFDEAVKKSGVIAKRAYVASSQEVLDAYRDSLYNGDWYVECEGGSLFGQGMYTVSDYTGEGKEEVESEISIYSKRNSAFEPYHVVEDITLTPDAKIADRRDLKDEWFGRFDPKKADYSHGVIGDGLRDIEEEYGRDAAIYARSLCSDPSVSDDDATKARLAIGRDMRDMVEDLSYDIMDRYEGQLEERSKKIREKYNDINAYAAALGYDAVKCKIDKEHATYTVILNRTKTIIRDGRGHHDDAEDKNITFRAGKNGRIEAVKDGRVIGWVTTTDYQSTSKGDGMDTASIKDAVEAIRERYENRRADEEDWVTIKGTHVLLNENGEAMSGGKLKGKTFSKAKSQKKTKAAEKSTAPKQGEHKTVNGKNIYDTYEGEGDITSVIHAQGFDGLPKVVSQDEFDKAVKASGFIAQRTYVSSSKETLEAYREALYNGKWYVECDVGGASFGQGMYTVSNYNGELTSGAKQEIENYRKQGLSRLPLDAKEPSSFIENITFSPDAKVMDYEQLKAEYFGIPSHEEVDKVKSDHMEAEFAKIREQYGKDAETYVKFTADPVNGEVSFAEFDEAFDKLERKGPKLLDKFDKEGERIKKEAEDKANQLRAEKSAKSDEIRAKFHDPGSYAAALGYDVIRVNFEGEVTSYTVFLNRTKAIILDGRTRKDAADKSDVYTFRPAENGRIEALKNGKVVGWIITNDYQSAPKKDGTEGTSIEDTVEAIRSRYESRRTDDDDIDIDSLLGDISLEDLMEDIDLEEEEGRWITTENGHKVHINGEGVPDKGNPFVLGVMKRKAPVTDVSKRTKSDFMPEGSYQENPDFKKALKIVNEAWDKEDALYQRIKEIEDELKTESKPKPKDEWDEEDEYQRLIGKRPMIYTEKGRQLAEEMDRLWDERRKAGDEHEKASDLLQKIKAEARRQEMADYHPEPLHRATSDDYEGFTLKKTSNSFGDEYLKNGEGVICEMSPREYLERCAFEIFGSGTMESCLNGIDEKSAREYAKKMKDGTKFDLPYLNYKGGGQEGRHRALAAYFNGIETIPVLVIGKHVRKDSVSPNRHVRRGRSLLSKNSLMGKLWASGNSYISERLLDAVCGNVTIMVLRDMDSRNDEKPDSWISFEDGRHIPLNEKGVAIGGAGGWAKGKDFSKAEGSEPKKRRRNMFTSIRSPLSCSATARHLS